MTIEQLMTWDRAHAKAEKRRARMLFISIAAAVNGGKSFDEFRRMTDEK